MSASVERRKILVVDDDRDVVDLTLMILRDGGYVVTSASNGRDGLAAARREKPDLLLLDINMPGMDGWETLGLLKLDEETKAIPVAMFSIRYDLKEKIEALKRSADDYIVKPFSYDDLLDRVSALLRGVAGQTRIAGGPGAMI